MKSTFALARTLAAPLFVTGGLGSLRNPAATAELAKSTVARLSKIGLPNDPTMLVRINGGLQLGAGLMLFSGRAPRLASAALAASLVPTTLAGHRFWDEKDPQLRSMQKVQFLKNLAILGGLVLLACDTKGAPSLGWRLKKNANKAAKSLEDFGAEFGATSNSFASSATDHFNEVSQRLIAAASPLLDQARKVLND